MPCLYLILQSLLMHKLLLITLITLTLQSCNAQHSTTQPLDHSTTNKASNKLINESSPYLQQHAYNPVDWHPWGDEALEKAQKEDKLIVISIGYAACHWCHVMEHESFEDSTVAELMNDKFVSIKVDREERPDIDQIYMNAVYLFAGRGGWPLNALALPDGRPVFAGTYYPKEQWMEILKFYSGKYETDKQALIDQAEKATSTIGRMEMVLFNPEAPEYQTSDLDNLFTTWKKRIDFKLGGKQGAPKFPMPNNYLYLLRYHHLTGNEDALRAVTSTLDNMANGGIYDHLGGGFARYSVDAIWLVPHFEKMLYDNAQLVSLYSEAYQLTKNPIYKKVVYETLEFIEREMTDKTGGFYSSLDADSEGEEGKFYVFTKQEIDNLLGEEDANIFNTYYNVTEKGNWEHHKNILHLQKTNIEVAKKLDLTEEQLLTVINSGKEKLFAHRAKRIRPGLDNKILTSWNALMIKGYTDAYRVFGEQKFLDKAIRNAKFLEENCMQVDYRLNRNYMNGKSSINAFMDDYALTTYAFISLYQATFDEQWLEKAKGLADYTLQHFYDETTGMFYYTSSLDKPLIARKMEVSDNVIPGANSIMARNLYYLGMFYYDKNYLDKSAQMLHNVKDDALQQPLFYSNWAILMLHQVQEPYEIAIVGDDFTTKRKELDQHYLPNTLLLGGKTEGNLQLLKSKLRPGNTMIYVCQNKSCKLPVQEVEQAIQQMGKRK